MGINCSTVSDFFDVSTHGKGLPFTVVSALKSKPGVEESVEDKYKKLIKKLKEQQNFQFGVKSTGKRYAQSIINLQSELLAIIDKLATKLGMTDDIPKLKSLFNDNFFSDAGVSYDTSTLIEEVEGPSMEGNPDMPNEAERIKQKMQDIVDYYYGIAIKADSYRKQQFEIDLIEAAIIDRDSGLIVKDIDDLNLNINALKNKYFTRIVEYLKSQDPNFNAEPAMFGPDGRVLRNYQQVFNKFYNVIKALKEDGKMESNVISGWKKRISGESDLFYDALNAYVNLVYFDTILEDAVGKVIQINNPAYKDDEWDYDYKKYGFSKGDEHKRKGFHNSEQRNALDDIAKFSKLILNTIPIYSAIDGKFLNRYVNIGNFANAITSLFVNVFKLGNDYTTLQEAVARFHDNPYYYSGVIFNEITNTSKNKNIQTALRGVGVNQFNLNILTSVFKHVYDTSNPKSIKSIETANTKKQFNINSYSIVDAINGVIDRIMDATYVQMVYSGASGMMEISEKPKFADRHDFYNLLNNINYNNFYDGKTPEARERLAKTYKVESVSGNVAYSVKIGNIIMTGRSSSKYGVLDSKTLTLTFTDKRIDKLFDLSKSSIDLTSDKEIQKILSGTNLSEEQQMFRDILQFIDEFLKTRILTPSGMDMLYQYALYSDSGNYVKPLLESALRAALINKLNKEFDDGLATGKYKSIADYEGHLKDAYVPFKGMNFQNSEESGTFIKNDLGIPGLITVRTSDDWMDHWITAKKTVTSEVSKSTTKDIHKNAIANNRTSFLGGNLRYYLSKYRDTDRTLILKEIGEFEGTTLLSDLVDDNLNVNWELFDKLQTDFFASSEQNLNNRPENHDGEDFTIQHIRNVVESAKRLPISDKVQRKTLVLAALLHDIAKPYHHTDHGLDAMAVINKLFKGTASDNLLKLAIRYHMLQAGEPVANYRKMLLAAKTLKVDQDDFIDLVLALNSADIQRNRPDDAIDQYSGKTVRETILEEQRIKRAKFEEAKKTLDQGIAATSPLLFTKDKGLVTKTLFNTDAQSRRGVKKSAKDMCASELFYSSIIFNFWGNYLQNDINQKVRKSDLQRTILTQPTTYSDKISFVAYAIKSNKPLQAPGKSYNGKTIYELDTEQTIDLYQDTIGAAYINLYNNVLDDLRTVLDMPTASFEEIDAELHKISQEDLLNKASEKGIELQLDTHYRKFGKVCKFNELLYHYANDLYPNRENLVKRFEQEKVNFVNDLINSGVSFYTTYFDDSNSTIQKDSSSNIISKIINAKYKTKENQLWYRKNWVKNNKLIFAKVTDKDGNVRDVLGGREIPADSKVELNPLFEKYFYTDSLLANNLRFELTGSEVAHPDKAKFNFTEELTSVKITPKSNPEYFKQITPIAVQDVKDSSQLFNLEALQTDIIDYDIVQEPWKVKDINGNLVDDPIKKKTVLKIYLKGKRNLGSFDLVADTNFENTVFNGEYSVHFKTGDADTGVTYGSTPEERALLYKYLIDAIPTGAKVSTWGYVSEGGKIALKKVGKGMFIVGTRSVFDRDGKPLNVDVFQKTEAISNFNDLVWLRNESRRNPILKPVYDKAILKVEAVAQGTQLKRNVIIPATLQYEQQNALNGIPQKMKVAVIDDTQAKIFNFRGDNTKEDAHDGSAYISPLISILENLALQDQEVGVDKKPIWHSFNPRLMSATLLKFATFTQTAERMRTSLKSDISLYKLFKQMHDLAWADLNDDGTVAKWNNSRGVSIDLVKTVGYKKNQHSGIDFLTNIVGDKPLFYEEDGRHYQITGFGRDENGYFTNEIEVNSKGIRNPNDSIKKIYHRFDAQSNHYKYAEGSTIPPITKDFHDINSLFQLYNVMGGIYAESQVEDEKGVTKLEYSDAASYATVNFMNNISVFVGTDTSDLSQRSYYQPLKEMLIGYAANKSAVKNGIANLNSAEAWKGDMKLRYMTLDTDGLGVQMDADHEIDESEMTEFSQVISALEAGGRLHGESKEVYKTLGRLAVLASKFEIDAATNYIHAKISETKKYRGVTIDEIRSELYDIFARTIINNYKQKEDRVDLTASIISRIKKTFDLNDDHTLDDFKLPSSDNSLYSQVIPTFVSNINKKSIKRKYPGSGCVMVPGYGIIQNYKYRGQIKQFDDVLKEARQFNRTAKIYHEFDPSQESITQYNHGLVTEFLKHIQEEEWQKATSSVEQFIPTDKVDVLANGKYITTIDLSDVNEYYAFQGYSLQHPDGDDATREIIRRGLISKRAGIDINTAQLTYAVNVTQPRDLAPARLRWKYKDANGVEHIENIFNAKPVRDAFMRKGDKTFNAKKNRKLIQAVFDQLDKGLYLGQSIYDFENEAAELVISNMYASKFNAKGKSLADILSRGASHFELGSMPIQSKHYDMVFTTTSGDHKYISFKTPVTDEENHFRTKDVGWKYIKPIGNDVYATTKDGQKLYKVGTYVVRKDLKVLGNRFVDDDGNVYDDRGNLLDQEGNAVKEVKKHKLRINGKGQVLEYKEFISHYKVTESVQRKGSGGHAKQYDLYVINYQNIWNGQWNPSPESVHKQIASILSNIYKSSDFNGVQLNKKMFSNVAQKLADILPRMEVSQDVEALLKLTVDKYLSNIDEKAELHIIGDEYRKDLKTYYDMSRDALYTSFLKSLTFTASRIPAQTLQSFMQMKAVGFTGSSKNIAYVSHWQTWLQGSD